MNTQSKVVGGLAVLLAVAMASPIVAQEKKAEEKKAEKAEKGKSREGLRGYRLVGHRKKLHDRRYQGRQASYRRLQPENKGYGTKRKTGQDVGYRFGVRGGWQSTPRKVIKTFSARSNLHPPRASRALILRAIRPSKRMSGRFPAIRKRQNKRNIRSFSWGGLYIKFSPQLLDSFLHTCQTQSMTVICAGSIKSNAIV